MTIYVHKKLNTLEVFIVRKIYAHTVIRTSAKMQCIRKGIPSFRLLRNVTVVLVQ